MQPEEALASIERTIRKAIRLMLSDWRSRISDRDAQRAQNALDNEAANRRGVSISGDILDYLYTRPAFELVREHWESFEPMLGDRARIEALLLFVEDVRNTVAHGRELVSYERDMVSGVAGYLSNLVALWETRSDDIAAHYPVITTVRDSFGREGIDDRYSPVPGVRVEVDDVIEFQAQAREARGKGVIWMAMFATYLESLATEAARRTLLPLEHSPVQARGANVRFRYRVTQADVGEQRHFWVGITSNSQHHRDGSLDDFRRFSYSVNPPRDR